MKLTYEFARPIKMDQNASDLAPMKAASTTLGLIMVVRHLEKITDIKITVPGKGCV